MPFDNYSAERSFMLVPCEIAVKCVLPAVRAMIAEELTTNHKLKQAEAARLLGVSQPAISLYHRRSRGKAISLTGDSDIMNLVAEVADSLAIGGLSHRDFIPMLCKICKAIRAKGLLCEMHKAFDPSIDTAACGLCLSQNPPECM
jgi:predicted transcriptional regulator